MGDVTAKTREDRPVAEVVYSEVSGDNDLQGSLFDGVKFWLSQRVPQRSRFITDIKARDTRSSALRSPLTVCRPMVGRSSSSTSRRMSWSWIMRGKRPFLERKSTSVIDCKSFYNPDISRLSYSYTFIEKSIRNGTLEDLEDHKVGPAPGTVRSIGSTIQPPKASRNKYTEEDDRVLWQWVHNHTQKGGGTDGNEIYKQLEAQVGNSYSHLA